MRLNQISLVAEKAVLLMFDDITCMWFHQAVIEPVREKTNNLGSDEVGHKPSCTSTDDGYRLEILDSESRGIVLSLQRKQRR